MGGRRIRLRTQWEGGSSFTSRDSVTPFERTIKSITGEPGKTGEMYELPKEVAGIFGWRLNKVEPKKALGFYIYDFRSGRSEATKEFTGGVEGLLKGGIKTPQDVIERYFIANKALFDVNKDKLVLGFDYE